MGICLEPPEYVTGLARVPAGTEAGEATVEFEQYERHTVWTSRAVSRIAPARATWT
jgi:hypothetical protein